MSDRYTYFLDPSGLYVLWDEKRQEPVVLNGKILAFKARAEAAVFIVGLNVAENSQRARRSLRAWGDIHQWLRSNHG